jgi:dephospho-CoA kinase
MFKKRIIGILGGIASGKSMVAGMFSKHGCKIIDADKMAHAVLGRPEVLSQLIARWGTSVLDSQGQVNRKQIAKIVFTSQEEVDFLNQQVHPYVLDQTERLIDRYQTDPGGAPIVLDMPLLLEVGWDKKCDFLVFVECSLEKRCSRIGKKGKIGINQLKKREIFQISLDKKKKRAHYTINNNSDKSDVAEQVAQIFSSITGSK